jgi:hypothetical protein
MSDDVVKIAEAGSEQEAAIICGLLDSNGIQAMYDNGGVYQPLASPAYFGMVFAGRQEILVHAKDAERAAQLLAEQR